jgi:FMN phosphatase YigB (HAD superfamily)
MSLVIPPARAVLFDAVGTLLRPHPPVVDVYQAAGRRFGCDLAREEVAARFRQAFARQEEIDADDSQCRTSEPRAMAEDRRRGVSPG